MIAFSKFSTLASTALLVTTIMTAGAAHASSIVNGTFDTNLDGWQVDPATTTGVTWVLGAANVGQPGTPGTATFFQEFSIAPGTTGLSTSFDYQWEVNQPSLEDLFSARILYDQIGGGTGVIDLLTSSSNDVTFNQLYMVNDTALLNLLDTTNVLNARIEFVLTENNTPTGTRVRLDNVAVSAVPLPAAAWLFISGLAGLFGFKRYKAT